MGLSLPEGQPCGPDLGHGGEGVDLLDGKRHLVLFLFFSGRSVSAQQGADPGQRASVEWLQILFQVIDEPGIQVLVLEDADVEVTMTAAITINGITYTDTYTFTVAKLEEGTPVSSIAEAAALGEDSYVNIQGVTVVGNNNVVRNEYLDLFNALEEIGDCIRSSDKLLDNEKMDLQNDLETIKNQLGKSVPNKIIIKTAWESIKDKLSKIPELADKVTKVLSLIKIFLG